MPKGNPYAVAPKEHQFKKGHVANPTGINIPAEERAFRNLTKQELVKIGNKIVQSTYEELVTFSKDDTKSGIHRMVVAQALKAIEHRDTQAFESLMNRLIGKVRDEILHQGDVLNAPQIILTLPDNGRSVKTIQNDPKKLSPPKEIEAELIDDDIDLGF